ncbi:MAG: hypothetical protein V4556_08405 [Bacteroidota bacterium]
MKESVLLFFLVFGFACSREKKNVKSEENNSFNDKIYSKVDTSKINIFNKPIPNMKVNDSIILISIFRGVEIHWNKRTNSIEEDSLLKKITQQFQDYKIALADEIENTFKTKIYVCPDGEELMAGDIAYLIIDKIVQIPVLKIMGVQFDLYQNECPYPVSFFGFLKKQRAFVSKNVKDYLKSHG